MTGATEGEHVFGQHRLKVGDVPVITDQIGLLWLCKLAGEAFGPASYPFCPEALNALRKDQMSSCRIRHS